MRAAAAADGLIDVAVGTVDSPIGELFVAVTPKGLACIGFDGQDRAELEDRFAEDLSPRVLASARATDDVRRQLDEYFGGARHSFELRVDHRLMSPFVRQVMLRDREGAVRERLDLRRGRVADPSARRRSCGRRRPRLQPDPDRPALPPDHRRLRER